MKYIVSQSIFLPLLFLLLFLSSCVCGHIPHIGRQRRAFQRKPQEVVETPKGLTTFYYKQPLDHFNYQPQSYVMFDQRYVIDFKYWEGRVNPKTPIFAYLGAENDIDYDIRSIGFLLRFASQYKAISVYLEHRFYGKSIPFGSLEKAMTNASIRGYLNSAQALADYADLLLHIKKKYAYDTSPVIVMGASYGGMLASWFRLKYPHVALGALASSAPILYFDNITPQDGYYSTISKSFKETSKTCHDTIRRSWSEIDRIAKKTRGGLSILSKRFKTCQKVDMSKEITDLLYYMYASAGQYNNPFEHPVKTICEAIDEEAKKKSDVIQQVIAGVIAYYGEQPCYDVYEFGYPKDPILHQYAWQKCSEMVMPIGISGRDKDSMFPTIPFDLNEYKNNCKALYGVSPKTHWVTTFYGGQDIKLVLHRFGSNIIFSNGLKDPYSSAGVLHNISETIVAITTTKGSHCLDTNIDREDDPNWLRMQRTNMMDIIDGWISKYYADLLLFNQSVGSSH